MALTSSVPGMAADYSAAAPTWGQGPGPIYDRLAEVVVSHAPVVVAGTRAVDVGSGTGAATRALAAAGTEGVVAVDAVADMLILATTGTPSAVVGDATALPFADDAFDLSIAAFSLNHLTEPVVGLRELARVTRPGGGVVVSSYAEDDHHPVKDAVEAALTERGWRPPPWITALRPATLPLLATPAGCADSAAAAGLDAEAELVRVPFPDVDVDGLVAWRLGMPQHARFVASLAPPVRAEVTADATASLVATPPLVRSVIVLRAVIR